MRLLVVVGDDDALAGRQAVGFDHERPGVLHLQAAQGVVEVVVAPEAAGGRPGVVHDVLGEGLAALELSREPAGTEHRQLVLGEEVGEAGDQGRLWADHGEVDVLLLGEGE